MKKIVLLMAMTVFATGAISAKSPSAPIQQGQGQGTPEERVERQTKMMTETLALTADQTTKLKPILLARATEQSALREKMQGDREAMMGEFRKLNEKYNPQIKAILTAEQYTKYEANQAQMRGGGQRGGQGGGNR
jgi:Spy/CpxP family protein refolding chaperone